MVEDAVTAANDGLSICKRRPGESKTRTRHDIVIAQQATRKVQSLLVGGREDAVQQISGSGLNLAIRENDGSLRGLIERRAEAGKIVVFVVANRHALEHGPAESQIESQTR